MPCPCCNHTMTNLGLDGGSRRVFWCPRCGTIMTETETFTEFEVPRWARLAKAGDRKELELDARAALIATQSLGA